MRCAILADIHANLAAFEAVLADIKVRGGVDEIWCLGDIVGYGPKPGECLELIRRIGAVCIAGNHDLATIGRLDTACFNPVAQIAAHWTAAHLSTEDIQYLDGLPLALMKGDFYLVHGSPAVPVMEYIFSCEVAAKNFPLFHSPYCLVGHTHMPLAFREEGDACVALDLNDGAALELGRHRLIINPGGVGQPRDGDPRASYAIYDSEQRVLWLHRVAYDVGLTQEEMLRAGLPLSLILRLEEGR